MSLVPHIRPFVAVILALLCLVGCRVQYEDDSSFRPQADLIEDLLEDASNDPNYLIEGDPLFSLIEVQAFYKKRSFVPGWIQEKELLPPAYELITQLQKADEEGLLAIDYHLPKILSLRFGWNAGKAVNSHEFARFDILLTDAYFTYAKHLYSGKVCPDDVKQKWHVPCRDPAFDFNKHLQTSLGSNEITKSLEDLKPPYEGYRRLKKALNRYRMLQKSAPERTPNPDLLQFNQLDLDYIRHRLIALGELTDKTYHHPDTLVVAINNFKERHGLVNDGVIDSSVVKLLQATIHARINTIEANLERWRWLPQHLGHKYIMVNIANFSLEVSDTNQITFNSNVITGTPFHSTPTFSTFLTHIILKPYWYVPSSIVDNEILSLSDPKSYLVRNKIKVLDKNNQIIVLDSIDWHLATPANFPYNLRQEPGPNNALGLIKFGMLNDFSIYIHDTPNKDLFRQAHRSFSHGCIRLEKPFELAAFLLAEEDILWNSAQLKMNAQEATTPIRINLVNKIPVHILYWTAWMNPDHQIQLRKDVYKRDALIIKALKEPIRG